jgi:hypothetical protein
MSFLGGNIGWEISAPFRVFVFFFFFEVGDSLVFDLIA